jgi:hypothetical protein
MWIWQVSPSVLSPALTYPDVLSKKISEFVQSSYLKYQPYCVTSYTIKCLEEK